jgi:hypothetical protein
MEEKKSYLSKSMWMGLIVAITGLLSSSMPSVHAWVSSNNELILTGVGIVSMVLRSVTKDKVVLW